VYRKTLTLSRELASELSYLEQEAASVLVDGVIEELKEKYPGSSVAEYLEKCATSSRQSDPFKEREGEGEHDEETPMVCPSRKGGPERDPFRVYGVNVILPTTTMTNRRSFSRPPPLMPIFSGTIQRGLRRRRGGWTSDFWIARRFAPRAMAASSSCIPSKRCRKSACGAP